MSALAASDDEQLSPKEQQVLAEYERLVDNLAQLNKAVHTLSQMPATQLLDNLRVVERKTGLVFTLFRSSVWQILAEQTNLNIDESMED
ncbi:DASH complex subunit Dad3-domain-containing protein [Protomyces lactucae-debilis]|uniref:DASH complex subunit DAD3 n=1 Tax=Protomyces lactucae-debilis TaxID=2754530 RepID=A0A1Y2F8H7_PROLT|nr:DASH complex subunit Dad3-domain-containing protein [Protomyces lactucae-debilis]ORY79937.1 DASH complex subunit Dad3-domain-containing protein [Protomyces lactucae-debilis]